MAEGSKKQKIERKEWETGQKADQEIVAAWHVLQLISVIGEPNKEYRCEPPFEKEAEEQDMGSRIPHYYY